MKQHSKVIYSLIALFVFASITYIYTANSQPDLPDLSFDDIDNQSHSFSDYKGQPLLVVFWATDCPGCIAEMPELIELYEQYSSQGLAMLGVAMSHDSLAQIKTMRKNKQLPYTITWDKTQMISAGFNNVRVTPTHFLVNQEGEIIMRKIGSLNIKTLHQKLGKMGLEASNI
jgi:peroxiredoxin